MSKKDIEKRVYYCSTQLIMEKGFVSPIDLLIRMERISQKQVEEWRFKKVPYLERVIIGNLGKLSYILMTLKKFAKEQKLNPSLTVYHSWGKGPKRRLRFSKTGNHQMEDLYSTHYIQINSKKVGD